MALLLGGLTGVLKNSTILRYKQKVFFPSSTSSLDQRLQAYYWLVDFGALVACQAVNIISRRIITDSFQVVDSYPSDLDNSFVDELVTLPCLQIYSKTMGQEISALSYFCTN